MTGGGGRDSFGGDFLDLDGDRITDFGSDDAILVFDRGAGELTADLADDGTDTTLTLNDGAGTAVRIALDGLFEGATVDGTDAGGARIAARRAEPDGAAAVIRGTDQDDTLLIAQNGIYLGLAGEDTLLLSPVARPDAVSILEGRPGDRLQLTEGLAIRASVVQLGAVELTLETGAVIRVLGADGMTFEAGANATTADPGVELDFAGFAETVLATPVPDTGSATGPPTTVTEDLFL